ncbi:hypothetical protein [Arcobacter sp. L]|uniref:hypothetical protein n=1 Tax=Arcobacter sp. L TaxID=944547 RepID=UPI0002296041|nr:hypothetical protein [Arcobacter sp. L]BAK74048.1 hypothetical protein ABLL_2173 [Arcobacter sp. L]
MKRNIFLLLIISFMTGCTALKSNKGSYTTTTYLEPIRYDKENGGHLVVSENNTKHVVFKFRPTDDENNKEAQNGYAEYPFLAYWKIGRNPLGMDPDYKECGEEPELAKYKLELGKEYREKEMEIYYQTKRKYRACTDNVTETFNSQTTYKYYYAKMPENHEVIYPAKSDMYYRWNLFFYIGGVNDLSIEAVPNEYKRTLEKLRTHECHKWGDPICYDLPNGDKNIYYAINEESYIIEDNKKVPKNRYSMDVRVSEPLNWIEIVGIEINKDMFDYLEKVCKRTFFCHFNDYPGDLTAEQKDYVEKVKWSKDLKWVEKVKE